MQTRIVQGGAVIAAVSLALIVARTEAFAAGKESCSTTTTDVSTGPSADGAVATCDAATDGPNGAMAKASGEDANATAEASDGSDAKATAKGGDSDATAEAESGSMAVSSAKGKNSDATAEAANGSNVQATASGTDSDAEASAENTGTNVTALATKGSTAIGSDTSPPTCMRRHGGKAVVTSPMGNCN